MTSYYPPNLDVSTGATDPELFHIEYEDGDEEDMDSTQLTVAMNLAQEHARATAAVEAAKGEEA